MSAICAISSKKIIGLQFFKGGIDGSSYGSFLINLLENNSEFCNVENKYIILMIIVNHIMQKF